MNFEAVYNKEQILISVKLKVQKVLPDATVILFGSRANNTQTEESDWDILVLTHTPVSKELKQKVHETIFPLSVSLGTFINLLLVSQNDWNQNPTYYSIKKSITLNSIQL